MTPPAGAARPGKAWVVFDGRADIWWLRLLKPGFRHCFVVLDGFVVPQDGRRWVVVDPVSPFTDVAVLDLPAGYDLPGWFRAMGMTVVAAPLRRDATRPAPWAPFTCVEAVKRVLGLHAALVLTPWQLYRRLTTAVPLLKPPPP